MFKAFSLGLLAVVALANQGITSANARESSGKDERLPREASSESVQNTSNQSELASLHQRAESGDPDAMFALANRLLELQEDPGQIKGAGLEYRRSMPEEALSLFKEAAKKGNAEAAYAVGSWYAWNLSPADGRDEKVVHWYQRAADLGHVEAMGSLATEFLLKSEDYEAAWMWYATAENFASDPALKARMRFSMAKMLEKGQGVEQDFARAFELKMSAHSLGLDSPSLFESIADSYAYGRGVERDLNESAKWHERRAEGGHHLTFYKLGQIYANGERAPLNYERSRYWYERAIDEGSSLALTKLADLLEEGLGGPENHLRAFELLERAAQSGDIGAISRVAEYYEEGTVVPQDFVQAYSWYNSIPWISSAKRKRDRLMEHMTPEQIAEAQELTKARQQQ